MLCSKEEMTMSIKYHQYGLGYEYGEDHALTNNWNPDEDYGNEYSNVYFNIDTPTYDGMNETEIYLENM